MEKDFAWINRSWVYYLHKNEKYSYFSMPLSLKTNPWDMFIYDKNDINKNPLITIFKDWRINIANELYYLDYSTFWDYVVYEIKEKLNNKIIWKVMLIPEKSFIIK